MRGTGSRSSSDPVSRIDSWLRLRDARTLTVRGLNRASLSVTEVRFDHPGYGLSDPVNPQDAYVFGVQLRAYPFHELWNDGKAIPVRQVGAGDTLIADMRTVEAVQTAVPFHSLQFFLPRLFLRELADDLEASHVGDLRTTAGVPVRDPVLAAFAAMVRPAVATPPEASDLWASHLMLAFGSYVAGTYGGLRTPRMAGGINAWQRRAVTELMEAHIDGRITIEELASVCGLSVSRFAHAFRHSFGVAPFQWLQARRIDRARTMLSRSTAALSDIALACGFADQSHFGRVFRRAVGTSPGAFRGTLRGS